MRKTLKTQEVCPPECTHPHSGVDGEIADGGGKNPFPIEGVVDGLILSLTRFRNLQLSCGDGIELSLSADNIRDGTAELPGFQAVEDNLGNCLLAFGTFAASFAPDQASQKVALLFRHQKAFSLPDILRCS